MRRPNRRKRPNRPHISSDISYVKEREDQIARAASFPAHLAIRASGNLASASASATSSDNPVSPRPDRFGEAVFRQRRKKPQGEKDRMMTLFSNY